MKILTQMLILLATVAYIVIGGIAFHFLEGENETETRQMADIILWNFTETHNCVSREEFREVLMAVLQAYQNGEIAMNGTDAATNWDYYSSIFFAMTVVTTIGYGNISPVTIGGRIFTVLFSLFGIPLFLVAAATIGDRFYKIIKASQKRCFKKDYDGNLTQNTKICGTVFYSLIGAGLFIFVPAAIFKFVENWDFTEACYYSYITVTTIGFGDYVAGAEKAETYSGYRGIYRLAVAGWIFFGLSWMAGVLSSIQDIVSKNVTKREQEILASKSQRNSAGNSRSTHGGRDRINSANNLQRLYSIEPYQGREPAMNGNVQNMDNSVPSENLDDFYLTKL